MSGKAPANQLRLSFTDSKDGEAETETCTAAKPLWRTMTRTSGPRGLNLLNRPMQTHVGWCGRGEQVTAPPMPIEPKAAADEIRLAECQKLSAQGCRLWRVSKMFRMSMLLEMNFRNLARCVLSKRM
jgi:hypothetical protein